MKRKLFIFSFLFFSFALAEQVSAQTKFGVRAGANLVNMKISDGLDNLKGNNRAGFYVGPTVKFTLPIVGLGMDASVLYDQRTSEVSYEGKTESLTARAITIPLNVRYGVGLGGVADVFAFAGPQVAFNLSKDKSLYNNVSDWTWKSSNFSVNVGIGATILSKVEIKANYNIACGKTGEATYQDATAAVVKSAFKSKYNSWQLGVAYYF